MLSQETAWCGLGCFPGLRAHAWAPGYPSQKLRILWALAPDHLLPLIPEEPTSATWAPQRGFWELRTLRHKSE